MLTSQDSCAAVVVARLRWVLPRVGQGADTPQLADDWAMRTSAMTRPVTAVAAEGRSILGLFDDRRAGRAPAQSLTARDLAYLKALYSTRSVSTAAQQRATMARIAARELAGRDRKSTRLNSSH